MLSTEWRHIDPEISIRHTDSAVCQRIYCFMRRQGLSFRRVTHVAQKRNCDPGVMKDWVTYIKEKQMMLHIPDALVANFDETNVYFAPEHKCTIAKRGSRTISLRNPNSSACCTAMLGVTMGGFKLPPYIIFKGKSNSRHGLVAKEIADPPKYGYLNCDNVYGVQEKAWMDEAQMLLWIEKVWKPFRIECEGAVTLLILDKFKGYMTSAVRPAIADLNTELEFVPAGYTSKLQVMDVGLNKPFKDRLCQEVDDWMVLNPPATKPQRKHVARWISDAWFSIREQMIENTWRHIGLNTSPIGPPARVYLYVDHETKVDEDPQAEEEFASDEHSTDVDPLAYNETDEDSDEGSLGN